MLRAGDALMAPDPLSGHGIYEALCGSLNVAAAVNTCLRTPQHAALALRFVAARARERFQLLWDVGARAYAQETGWPEALFWKVRRQQPHAQTHSGPPSVVHDAPVFERDLIVPASIVLTANYPRGVWRVHDVPVVPLLTRLRGGLDLDAAARALDVPCERAARARWWLCEEGLLDRAAS
jgi:menaquinone-9 beta-reductase